ncbi:hypothetical protein ACQP00_20640 [Dactylosporangium sp. CS-047395]|uniref:hypothetical protein n=1 Tax=Dactylosporangium sp. CS-047395 TaxID=3239936 RepID=UPI003D94DC3F
MHVIRGLAHLPADLPVQQVSVLGEHDVCSACAHQIWVRGPAGALHVAAGLTVAAAQWVAEFERLAPSMGWLDVARWSRQTPFGSPDPMTDPMTDLLSGLLAVHRSAVAAAWDGLRRRVAAAMAVARQAAGPPGLRVMAARARDLLLHDRATLMEAHVLEAIRGGARRILHEPQLPRHALDAWLQGGRRRR